MKTSHISTSNRPKSERIQGLEVIQMFDNHLTQSSRLYKSEILPIELLQSILILSLSMYRRSERLRSSSERWRCRQSMRKSYKSLRSSMARKAQTLKMIQSSSEVVTCLNSKTIVQFTNRYKSEAFLNQLAITLKPNLFNWYTEWLLYN